MIVRSAVPSCVLRPYMQRLTGVCFSIWQAEAGGEHTHAHSHGPGPTESPHHPLICEAGQNMTLKLSTRGSCWGNIYTRWGISQAAVYKKFLPVPVNWKTLFGENVHDLTLAALRQTGAARWRLEERHQKICRRWVFKDYLSRHKNRFPMPTSALETGFCNSVGRNADWKNL